MTSREILTKRVALQIQIALTAWHELYPDDSDEEACQRSLELVEQDLEEILTQPDPKPESKPPPMLEPEPELEPTAALSPSTPVSTPARRPSSAPPPSLPTPQEPFIPRSFRQLLIELGREFPGGFDISTVVEEAEARGWSHHNPRTYVSLCASQLVRSGVLVRQDRGTYALSPEFS